jgi:hypothetical protein
MIEDDRCAPRVGFGRRLEIKSSFPSAIGLIVAKSSILFETNWRSAASLSRGIGTHLRLQFKMRVIGSRKGSKITLLRKCTMAAGVLIFLLPSGAPANCVAHCLLIQRGMEANAQGSSVAEWSQSSGILREDLGTVAAPLDSIDSECEKTKQNFLESPSVSKKERVERYVRLHTLGIDDHLDLVPASSWTADKTNPKLIVKIEPPRCK